MADGALDWEHLAEISEGPRIREYHYAGIMEIEDPERRLEAAFSYISTLLTLRRVAAAHMRELWVNWKLGTIEVPALDPCWCIDCWRQAHSQWLKEGFDKLDEQDYWEDDVNFGDLTRNRWSEIVEHAELEVDRLVELCEAQFSGKTENASRRIPFGMSERATAIFRAYFEMNDHWDHSSKHINDLIKEGAENRPELDEEVINAHQNRAEGISFFTRLYPELSMVKSVVGHGDLGNVDDYLVEQSRLNVHQAFVAAGREKMAPDVSPENPEAAFPVLLDSTPFEGEREMFEHVFGERLTPAELGSEIERQERASDLADRKLSLVHPRDYNLPTNREAFPSSEIERPEHVELPTGETINVNATEEFCIKGNRTLKEYQEPHNLPSEDAAEPRDFRAPTDPVTDSRGETLFASSPSLGIGQMVNSTINKATMKSREISQLTPVRAMLRGRRIEIAQMIRASAKFVDPNCSATIDWDRVEPVIGMWIALIIGSAIILPWEQLFRNPGYQIAGMLSMLISFYRLPWQSLHMADFLPVRRQTLTLSRSPILSDRPLSRR